ncbi:hypothetical protein QA612_06370 [Evansella sp. AB-P1]|uniref:hypothetical protein n=1 Tax=Evansella sp. AB-P1 TaxID=3037653 RepID=UPI00241DF5AC|nr:hypothetical protein [Evansella sp. AB-P1]MDG5787112.1 hypothetical protein [Evansella sp. AB-P1]
MKFNKLFLLISLCLMFLITGCGGSSETAGDHDVELPNGVEKHLPLPSEAQITFRHEDDNYTSFMYRPGISYPDAVEFFSDNLATEGWTLTREEIPERTEGEREAMWEAEGHGVSVRVTLTSFGGPEGFNMTGFVMVRELD